MALPKKPHGEAGPAAPIGANYIPRSPLTHLVGGARFQAMDRSEAYYRCTQDDHKSYDWDGYFRGYGDKAAIEPGWYVPLAQRRPAATYATARVIVSRLTSMLFGDGNNPEIQVAGDSEAEQYVRELAKGSKLMQRVIEARNLGGACGAVCLSYGFHEGQPRVEVHNGKHCRVLAWVDRSELVPEAVLKTYEYQEEVWDHEAKKYLPASFVYARLWTQTQEFVWEKVPRRAAKLDGWWEMVSPDREATFPGGECPVIWVQNTQCSNDPDGESDYHGQLDNMDQLNRLKSASGKGTIANVDPTLVIKDSKSANKGVIRKGSANAIYSPGGAEYLELKGAAVAAAIAQCDAKRMDILDACQVVIPSAEKLSGAAQSAAAMRILFAPMTARCDVLREQYGDMGIVRVLGGMLRMAKAVIASGGAIVLDDRVVTEVKKTEVDDDDGEEGFKKTESTTETTMEPQVPGEREQISLTWPPYFPATWADKKSAIEAAKAANGGKQIISQRTSVRMVAQMCGVEDVDEELVAIGEDADASMERESAAMQQMMQAAPPELEPSPGTAKRPSEPPPPPGKPKPKE
jgi:hypothetical protein